jgi:DtxR family Mn-dependent transcriptional regulator
MPKIEVNHTVEDYLRSVYRLEVRDNRVSNAALARELGISSAAVTEMLRRLSDQGLLQYQKYQEPRLTTAGRTIAMSITRRHRLWEVFLIQHLGFAWDEVHEIADELEHVSSDILIERLDGFLGHPTHDPHGDPIPGSDGSMPTFSLLPISDMKPGEEGIVERVSDEFPELLRYAASLGLSIRTRVRVLERVAFDCSTRLMANGRESMVSEKLARSGFVSQPNETEGKGR